ncbi:MAG TPA: ABC transporter substrate-binding protein [Candidatus Methylomirabilis sp.]|nr:ABC transporter substrate-binding protein [Candidatus Methylomirabilis sp.]
MSRYRWFSAVLMASIVAASGASAQQLAVGSGIDPSQGLWLIAQQKGFATKYGLQLDVKTFESGSFPLEAVTAGDLVAAGTNGALPSLGGRAKGGRYLGVARGLTAPRLACAVATATVKAPKDLEGKNVGILPGSSSELWWARYARYHKIERVKTVKVAPAEMVTALRGGQIDSFFIWEPWCFRATGIVSGAHVLAYGGDNNVFPFPDLMINFSESLVRNQPDTAVKLLRALYDAAEWVQSNPEAAAQIFASAYRGKVDEFTTLTKQMNFGLRLDGSVYEVFYDFAGWMKQNGLITVPDTKALVDGYLYPDLLAKIDPTRVGRPTDKK